MDYDVEGEVVPLLFLSMIYSFFLTGPLWQELLITTINEYTAVKEKIISLPF
jgi:hypothetical protein